MKIAIGSDHAGFLLKEKISAFLKERGEDVIDHGTYSKEMVDYPLYARKVASEVSENKVDRGIIVCGSGIGVCIVANKISGIRAALCTDENAAKLSRQHNDANVLALGERTIDWNLALKIVETWIETSFEGGVHIPRLQLIEEIEDQVK